MEENMQHFWRIVLYYFSKGKDAPETQTKTGAVYTEGAATDRTCRPWFAKFLGNSLQWGRLMRWKMFRSTPGCYPLEANIGR